MKKICILGMCLLAVMAAMAFTGCNEQAVTDTSNDSVSSADGQSVSIDEADLDDPFGE